MLVTWCESHVILKPVKVSHQLALFAVHRFSASGGTHFICHIAHKTTCLNGHVTLPVEAPHPKLPRYTLHSTKLHFLIVCHYSAKLGVFNGSSDLTKGTPQSEPPPCQGFPLFLDKLLGQNFAGFRTFLG